MTTTAPTRYDQAHVYLDESGLLHGELHETDRPQVGGVVVLGDAAAVNGELLDLLRACTEEAGAAGNAALHQRNATLGQILHRQKEPLAGWSRGSGRVYGVVIRHQEDLGERRLGPVAWQMLGHRGPDEEAPAVKRARAINGAVHLSQAKVNKVNRTRLFLLDTGNGVC
jgi:hypothetical protein